MNKEMIGSAPWGEYCAQVGTDSYTTDAFAECTAYKNQLLRIIKMAGKTIPEDVKLFRKSESHDYGNYYEIAVRFPNTEEGWDFFSWLEDNIPENWDDEAKAEMEALKKAA